MYMVSREKYVFLFEEGRKEDKALLGGKGANLAEMARIGLPVPAGFTISTKACIHFLQNKCSYPAGLKGQVLKALKKIEAKTKRGFGGKPALLVSVRSGAPVSMPGMMDTILNLGLNDETLQAIISETNNERFAYDLYRRLIQMFGGVVKGINAGKFDSVLEGEKEKKGVKYDSELDASDLKRVVKDFKRVYKREAGEEFPQDVYEQLFQAIDAVFSSWNNKRAITYRKLHGLPDDMGTAVNVQMMVYGNKNECSGTGVAFTRNPSTGEKELYGEYLLSAQGEDVVAGIRTPKPIKKLSREMPKAFRQLEKIAKKLERHYRDMQDFEFTIEDDKLYMLQTRTGKRTAMAAVRIAVEMVREGLIDKKEALMRVTPEQLNQLLHKQIDPSAKLDIIAKGLPASPGAACGKVVFDADVAEAVAKEKEKVLLVRPETTPEDIHGVIAAQGVLTSRGGMTCVVGETNILTDKGFFSAEELFNQLEKGTNFKILSFDTKRMKAVWRDIIAAGRRVSEVEEFEVSQTGRTEGNILRLTPDHKLITFEDGHLIKKEIDRVFQDNGFLCLVDKLPETDPKHEPALAYVAGAILTDGYINLKKTKGSVTFTQKDSEEKKPLFQKIKSSFKKAFDLDLSYSRSRTTNSFIGSRAVSGQVVDLICFKRMPAIVLSEIKENTVAWAMGLDEESTLEFLAGVLDGDGSFSNNRIQLYVSSEGLAQAIVVSCLRLGIIPQVTLNRNIYNIQIVERLEDIVERSAKIFAKPVDKKYGSKLFSIKQALPREIREIGNKGRTREMLKRNLLMDANKLARDYLPFCSGESKAILRQILNSDLRMYRLGKNAVRTTTYVYNFEVGVENELDKNFVVFSSRYSPVLVSNSHAAVVARGMGKPCVAGCESLKIDLDKKEFRVGDIVVKEFEWLTIDGTIGSVILGQAPMIEPKMGVHVKTLLSWADRIRRLGVKANADNPVDSAKAREFGAEGIGLCRTEHMFMAKERVPIVHEMIMASGEKERRKALEKLLVMQRNDFYGIFKAMDGFPVIIRLLDPPLHEFLPNEGVLLEEIRKLECKQCKENANVKKEMKEKLLLLKKARTLAETNPMLGHRGVRLGLTFPEIYEMQVQAIIEAAIKAMRGGVKVKLQIMIPLVGIPKELERMRELAKKKAIEVMKKKGSKVKYKIGTMIELPRACAVADEIAEYAEFFSFGTNDLTQTTFGFSRDDAEAKFLPQYIEKGILEANPFARLDTSGVGELMKIAIKKGRAANKKLELGICGEHGGNPESIEFCHEIGLDYVSCSPYRVPIARLAAAQAALKKRH